MLVVGALVTATALAVTASGALIASNKSSTRTHKRVRPVAGGANGGAVSRALIAAASSAATSTRLHARPAVSGTRSTAVGRALIAAAARSAAALLGLLAPARTGLKATPLKISNLLLPSTPLREGPIGQTDARRITLFDSPTVPYSTADGMTVYIAFSDSYVPDPAVALTYVDFLDWLVHAQELNGTLVHIYTPAQISSICGQFASACYAPAYGIFVAGDATSGVPVEQALAHEYGHNIAYHRSNAPWPAIDWGPKRWASYENVCSLVYQGKLFPGAETQPQYQRNPGEGWAEAYRRMNELRAGNWHYIGWGVVDPYFIPDATALALIEQDVTEPWNGPTAYAVKGRLVRHGVRRWRLQPLDGPMSATVTGARGMTVSFSSGGRVVRGPAGHVSGTVCGDTTITVAVRSNRAGTFRLRVTSND
jgi:hypothetical protein